jgi:hypothetical protein
MTYLKCALVGLVAAFMAVVGVIAVWLSLFLAPTGSGGLVAVSGGLEWILVVAGIGFALGFWLTLRRQRRRGRFRA